MAKVDLVQDTEAVEELVEGAWYADWLADSGLDDPTPSAPVEMDVWVDRRLAAIGGIEAEIKRNLAAAERRVAMIMAWRDSENAALERRAEYLREQLKVVARSYPYAGKKKSRELPHGVIGKQSSPERLTIVDPDAALRFSKEKCLEIKRKESAIHKVLVAHYHSTGRLPYGTEIVPATETVYVKAKGGGDVAE